MRYWLSNGDGQVYGPYGLDELRAFAASGRVSAATQLCQEGTTNWVPSTAILGVSLEGVPPTAPVAEPPPGVAGGFAGASWSDPSGAAANWQPVGIVAPILAILFCCLPAGVVSLVYATNANTKAAQGNFAGAEADRKSSSLWLRIAVLPAVVAVFFYIAIALVAVFTNKY